MLRVLLGPTAIAWNFTAIGAANPPDTKVTITGPEGVKEFPVADWRFNPNSWPHRFNAAPF
jgi:hypothetical protein